MDLEDSFTKNLLERTQVRREQIDKKLGLTPIGTALSTKRRRTPLGNENIELEDTTDGNSLDPDEEETDSPKRQCFDDSLFSANSEVSQAEVTLETALPSEENKENTCSLPVLGFRGLAALKRKNNDSGIGHISELPRQPNHLEHEESQGFTKSSSYARLTYAYPENDQLCDDTSTTVKDRMRMFETSSVPSAHEESIRTNGQSATVAKPLAPMKGSTYVTSSASSLPCSESQESCSRVDPAELSVAARKALFESPVLEKATREKSPEKLSVSQRATLFEKAMFSNGASKAPRNVGRFASPAKIDFHTNASSCVPTTSVPPKLTPSLLSSPTHHNAVPKLCHSPGILRKGNIMVPNGNATKIVRFCPSPSQVSSALPPVGVKSDQQGIVPSAPKSPAIGSNTQAIQQRLLGQVQKGTSACCLVEKSIADRKREMEMLLFNKRSDPEPEDSVLSQEGDSETKIYNDAFLNETVTPSTSIEQAVVKEDGKKATESAAEDYSFMRKVLDIKEINITMDNILDPASSQGKPESEYSALTAPSISKRSAVPDSLPTGEDKLLLHSVSVYRRQKQALCTPPTHIIQRKPAVESPPSSSPPAKDDPAHIQELHAKIQNLQKNLHCQEVQVHQACQALSLCATKPELFGSAEHIEGERLLLIANHKRNAYRSTLERLKTESALGKTDVDVNTMGTLTFSEIRLPLKHDFLSAQMAGTDDDSVHFFFCVIRYREKVIATEMLSSSGEITAGTLSFSNHICIQGLENNFSVLFGVYALQTSGENHIFHERKSSMKKDSARTRTKKHESKSKLSTVVSSPMVGQVKERLSNFGLVGFIQFTVDNCNRKVLAMEKVPPYSPLDGRVYIKIQLCTQQPVKEKGFLTMFEDVSGFGAWHRRWVELQGNHLSFWKYPDQVGTETPIGSIDLRTCVTPHVDLVSADVCVRKNTFMLFCVRPKYREDHNNLVVQKHSQQTTIKHLISADTKEERVMWCQKLNAALETLRRWDPQALKPQNYPSSYL